jgi:hypothetical protein
VSEERKRTWQIGHDTIVVIMDFAAMEVEPVANDNCFRERLDRKPATAVLHINLDLLTRWPKPRFKPIWEKRGRCGMDAGD